MCCLSAVACNTKNNEPEPPEHTRTADSVWQNDENKHWHNCTTNDGYKFNDGSHVYDNDQDAECNTCGVNADSAFTSASNDAFTLQNSSSSATYTVTALLDAGGSTSATANDNSGITFSNAFLPNSASNVSMTVTAKKAINVTVYYTTSDSKFNTQSQSKSGYLQWTINGGTQSSDSNTANKDGRTAYAVKISLSAGDVLVLTSSGNRLVVFGVVAE